ncbi:MAG: endonuclease [Bdellovibrionia bacterium]
MVFFMLNFWCLLILLLVPTLSFGSGNTKIKHFRQAKRLALEIHKEHSYTIYCNCRYSDHVIDLKSCAYQPHKDKKRAERLEWEHVVPAEAFGQSFEEWRTGSAHCVRKNKRYKGRKCAENNPEFARIEADLYNLWPEDGELNGLRNNFAMAELGAEKSGQGDFGGCKAKIEDRKFEPMPAAKGKVARVYMYMDQSYPGRGIISDKNRKLFEAWDKLHPVDEWECKLAKKIEAVQGNENPILKSRCPA